MSIIPKIEPITRDLTLSHIFLMFGYKLFSVYFPLFLVAKNFNLHQIGYTNFLIYLPIAVFAPLVGFINHKVNPAILSAIGILGYGIYALGMILFPNLWVFYLLQIILGISAALFFVSSRAIIMAMKMENPDRSFGWFYSAPSYADAIAPVVGAVLIWKFGFVAVFGLSLIFQIFNTIFYLVRIKNKVGDLKDQTTLSQSANNYSQVFQTVKNKKILPYILISFLVLIGAGFNNTFFVLFLKNIGWSQNQILFFNSLLSLIFLPISIFAIKKIQNAKSEINISNGSQIVGFFSILLGGFSSILNFFTIFLIMIGKSFGGLITNSGRSGFLSKRTENVPEESAAVDTIFSPLATAAGSLLGGLLIGPLGYPVIFILFGLFMYIFGYLGRKSAVDKESNLS